MSKMENVKCNLCGSSDYNIFYSGIIDEKKALKNFSSSSDDVSKDQIVKCSNCGLVYVNPRIKEKFVVECYTKGIDEKFVSQNNAREKTFEKSIKMIEVFDSGKILDIGTASGGFLKVAKDRGWDTYGIEPNKWLCDWAKKNYNLNIIQGTLFDKKFPKNYFDVVTMWDVLEHVHDPAKTLKEIYRILKPGGLLVINYPDIGSAVSRLMKRKWVFLLTVHLYYFTPKTISSLLSKNGFRAFKINRHVQKLDLEYLVLRTSAYNKTIYKILNKLIKSISFNKLQIPYWLGQNVVLARKE